MTRRSPREVEHALERLLERMGEADRTRTLTDEQVEAIVDVVGADELAERYEQVFGGEV